MPERPAIVLLDIAALGGDTLSLLRENCALLTTASLGLLGRTVRETWQGKSWVDLCPNPLKPPENFIPATDVDTIR